MFERFTERARQVVVLAQDESRRLGHDSIGTEHILLGLLREEEGIAARVLETLDVTLEEVQADVIRVVGRGETPETGQIPFTPGGKKTLELALREAVALGHDYIGTEHVLLGLVRADEGVGAEILREHDADPERIRQAIIRMLSGSAPLGEPKPEPDEVELTCPPLAPEVLAELERLTREKEAAVERQAFDEAASLRDAEHYLRSAAVRLVSAWRRHTDEPT